MSALLIWPAPSADNGPGIFAARLACEFARRGYRVTVNPLGRWDHAIVNVAAQRFRLLARVARGRPLCFRVAGWYMPDVFATLGRKWSLAMHRINVDTAYAISRADMVIYQTKWAKRSLDRLQPRADRLCIIPNGTDIMHFRPMPLVQRPRDVATLGSVGDIRHERLATLVRLSRLLPIAHRFVVVGRVAEDAREQVAMIQSDPLLSSRFRLVGAVSNSRLPHWYATFDCLVHPVPGDPCPNAVIEAMACGIPIATLGEGGAAEVSEGAGINVPGLLTDLSEPRLHELAQAITTLVAKRDWYGRKARDRAMLNHDIARVAGLYLEALGLPPHVPRRGAWGRLQASLGNAGRRHSRCVVGRHRKPVIAFALWDFYMGGMASWIHRLASALKDEYEYAFLATSCREFAPQFHRLGRCAYLPSFLSMWRWFRENPVDLLQAACQRWPIDAARAAGVRSIIERTDGTRSCCIVPKDKVDLVIASSMQTADLVRRVAPSVPVEVIYNAIDVADVDASPIDKTWSNGALAVGRACRIGNGKRLDLLVEACALLPDTVRYQLVIVGGESHLPGADSGVLERLREQARALDVNAVFVGERADPLPVIKGFDIGTCVSAPYNEGIPNSLIESMAARQPVVSTAIDQVSELIADGENGLLVPPGDSGALADALGSLLSDPGLCARLGAAARETVESRFSMPESVQQYRQVYRRMTGL
ncbi:MAG: glycosyltransferase family 4 protein [Anaerolineae bacterium]